MGFTVATTATTQISNTAGNVTGKLELQPVTFAKASIGGTNYETYAQIIPSRIASEATETYNLGAYYTKPKQITKLLVVKSSRPVLVTISGTYNNLPYVYALPPQTYFEQLFDSREVTHAFKPTTITITNPAPSATQPSPLPDAYPAAEIEVLVAVQEEL